MTLEPYTREKLDELTLRMLDLTAKVRQMAEIAAASNAAGSGDGPLPLHDRKALQWLASLEDWAHDSLSRLQMAQIKRRGAKRAEQFSA